MEDSVIFPRKYPKVIITYAWHVSVLISSSVVFMSTLAFLKSLFLLVYSTLAYHREMQFLDMGGEPRK